MLDCMILRKLHRPFGMNISAPGVVTLAHKATHVLPFFRKYKAAETQYMPDLLAKYFSHGLQEAGFGDQFTITDDNTAAYYTGVVDMTDIFTTAVINRPAHREC